MISHSLYYDYATMTVQNIIRLSIFRFVIAKILIEMDFTQFSTSNCYFFKTLFFNGNNSFLLMYLHPNVFVTFISTLLHGIKCRLFSKSYLPKAQFHKILSFLPMNFTIILINFFAFEITFPMHFCFFLISFTSRHHHFPQQRQVLQ